MEYFEDTRIGKKRRADPLILPSEWNCFQRVVDGLAKTNNDAEGWHRSFQSMMDCHHPNLWRLIDGFQKEQSLNELVIAQYSSGQAPPPSKRTYRERAENLRTVVETYGTVSTVKYLTDIAHLLK